MRKFIQKGSLIFGLILILTACQSTPKVNVEDVIKESFNKRDEIENYFIDTDLKVKISSPVENQTSTAELKGVIDEKNDEANLEIVEKQNNEQAKQQVIYKDGKQYLQKDGEWTKYEEEIDNVKESGTTYYEIMNAVNDFDEYAEIKKDGKEYIASFKGSAQDVFYVFQEVFSLSLTGADLEEDTTMEVIAKFDEKTLFLTSLTIDINAEANIGEISMEIETTFTDINKSKVEGTQEAIDATK